MTKQKLIFTGKHGRPSTKVAYDTMASGKLVQRRQVFRGKGPNRVLKNQYYRSFYNNNSEVVVREKEVSFEDAIVARWGTREPITTNKGTIVYNNAKAIEYATNKMLSREMFIAAKVGCPKLITPENIIIADLPIIARPLVHSKGKNFVILKSIAAFNQHNKKGWYYSNFIDKEREFRIHAAHGKAIAVMEKVPPKDGNIAWNRAQNDTDPFIYIPWSQVDKEKLRPVILEGLRAVQSLKLDFGGVDVMLSKGKAYVLEVNTAPTLNTSPYVASRWGMYFDWLFRQETRRDHWEYEKFEKGSSMIWKNYQLKDESK